MDCQGQRCVYSARFFLRTFPKDPLKTSRKQTFLRLRFTLQGTSEATPRRFVEQLLWRPAVSYASQQARPECRNFSLLSGAGAELQDEGSTLPALELWKNLVAPTSQSCSSERTLFDAVWKMSRIFREISCGHFPWKLKDENLQDDSPNVHRTFRASLAQISQELRSGGKLA